MSLGPDPRAICIFPGPARFVQDIVADLDSGKSVVIVLPDALIDAGIADSVLSDIAMEGAHAERCDASAAPFPNRILSTFGAEASAHRSYGGWDTFVAWEPWHRSWIMISAWEHPDVVQILERWPAQVKACELSEDDRPKLVIGLCQWTAETARGRT